MSGELKNIVEAVLMVSDSPLTVARIQGLFERDSQPSADEVKQALRQLQQECEERGVELRKIGSGYRYHSRQKYAGWIRKLHATRPPKLSGALLETLAIIAYRQPVTRGDIEEIRGVGVTTEIMRRLLERGWIKEVGVRDLPGHPALFATTPQFLSYFNLESLSELPPLQQQREFSEISGELDTPLPPELLAALREPPAQQDVFQAPPGDKAGDKAGDKPSDKPGTNGGDGEDAEAAPVEVESTPPAVETEQPQPAFGPETIEPEETEKAQTES